MLRKILSVVRINVFLLCIVSAYSCTHDKKNPSPIVSNAVTKEISVENAKIIYEKEMIASRTAKTKKRKRKETPVWESSKNLTIGQGIQALVVLVEEGDEARTLTSFDSDTASSKSLSELVTGVRLVVYYDSQGAEHIERMYVKAEMDYVKRKNYRVEDADFTGRIWYEDFEDNFLRAFDYENGKVKSMQVPQETNVKNTRIAYECTIVYETVTITTAYYSVGCSSSDCGPPQFMYNLTETYVNVLFQSCYNTSPNSGNSSFPYPGSNGTANIWVDDPAFWDWFNNRANSLEKAWLWSNPDKALKWYTNFRQAEVSSQQRFGGAVKKDSDGTNQNAYKHAYAAALQANSWDSNVALEIMNNHENGPDGPNVTDLRTKMDYFNNALGLNTVNMCGCGGETLRNMIQTRINNGQGRRVIYGNDQTFTTLQPTTSGNIDND